MSKLINLTQLKNLLTPITNILYHKAEDVNWGENDPTSNSYIENRPFYENDDGTIQQMDEKFIPDELKVGRALDGKNFEIDGSTKTAGTHAEIFGDYDKNIAIGDWSASFGSESKAIGRASFAEGVMSQAIADGSHVEGYGSKATGYWSHAEGEMTSVTSYASHAEGSYCTLPDGTKRYGTAGGYASHTEGGGCHTTGSCAHAEGLATTASGDQSHVEGRYTIAAGGAQHVEGTANIEDTGDKYIHIAGNGTFEERSNAHTLAWDGTAWFAGDVYVGSASGKDKDEGSVKLISTSDLRGAKLEIEEYVNEELTQKGIIRKKGSLVQHNCEENRGISIVSNFGVKQEGIGNPYPAGCGKNLVDISRALKPNSKSNQITNISLSENAITLTGIPTSSYAQLLVQNAIPAEAVAEKTITLSGTLDGAQPHILIAFNQGTTRLASATLNNTGSKSVDVPAEVDNVSLILCLNRGNFDGTTEYTATYTNIQVEVGSTATTFEPYSNVRPFIGYDNVSITQNGKNLMPEWEQGTISTGTGENSASSNAIRSIGYIPVVPNTLYTISRIGTGTTVGVRCYDKDKNYIGIGGVGTTTVEGNNNTNPINQSINKATIKVLEGCYYLRFNDYTTNLTNQYQLEVGEVATAYDSYKSETFTMPLGDTYYGGSVNWNTGEMVIDKASYIATGADNEYWEKINASSADGLHYFFTNIAPANTINAAKATQQCSHYPHGYVISNDSKQNIFRVYTPTNGQYERFCIRPDVTAYPNLTTWKAYLKKQYDAGTPVQVVYELTKPIKIQLNTSFNIKALQGINTITGSPDISSIIDFNRDTNLPYLKTASKVDILNAFLNTGLLKSTLDSETCVLTNSENSVILF